MQHYISSSSDYLIQMEGINTSAASTSSSPSFSALLPRSPPSLLPRLVHTVSSQGLLNLSDDDDDNNDDGMQERKGDAVGVEKPEGGAYWALGVSNFI